MKSFLRTAVFVAAQLVMLPALALGSEGPQVTLSARSLILGSGEKLEARIGSLESGEIYAAASVGTLRRLGPLRFEYEPPASPYPQVAVLVFWSEDREDAPPLTILRVPLIGRTELEASTGPLAQVTVKTGGKVFGPVRADAQGVAHVPLEIFPGVSTAEVIADSKGKQITRIVPLGVPTLRSRTIAASSHINRGSYGWLVVVEDRPESTAPAEIAVRGGRLEPRPDGSYRILPTVGDLVRIDLASTKTHLEMPVVTPPRSRWGDIGALGGVLFAGGHQGYWVSAVGGYQLPFLPGFSLELSAGLKRLVLSRSDLTGSQLTEALGLPIEVSLRIPLLTGSWAALTGRVGGGVMPFRHTTTPSGLKPYSEFGVGFDGFAAVQGVLRLGPIEPFLEARGTFGPLRTERLNADASALELGLGVRFPIFGAD